MAENLSYGTTFYLLSAGLIIWIFTACMDFIVSGARYFINQPYIREIVVEVQKGAQKCYSTPYYLPEVKDEEN